MLADKDRQKAIDIMRTLRETVLDNPSHPFDVMVFDAGGDELPKAKAVSNGPDLIMVSKYRKMPVAMAAMNELPSTDALYEIVVIHPRAMENVSDLVENLIDLGSEVIVDERKKIGVMQAAFSTTKVLHLASSSYDIAKVDYFGNKVLDHDVARAYLHQRFRKDVIDAAKIVASEGAHEQPWVRGTENDAWCVALANTLACKVIRFDEFSEEPGEIDSGNALIPVDIKPSMIPESLRWMFAKVEHIADLAKIWARICGHKEDFTFNGKRVRDGSALEYLPKVAQELAIDEVVSALVDGKMDVDDLVLGF